ncbi:1,4-dihydroxy-2-naphthoate polyprenyltransferase [Shewanella sedimentimangrovi]|uniref:1,4-dihydroxy-2-naphthoate octaprenyltransferase n=1 Tax=Shewanella sedimentimangrovi TaxID=2814293 RepID=A0ABX7R3G3_9GAMM|nr:1,4-dihydroxy-2-naphthoate polyprenyltransferase [Shewanella sedimentimangrovi]QSX38357.1 1,4-dihydroxy-2-naphthoate polyprenyltransferase [Shewanella sedimentimangrovi]
MNPWFLAIRPRTLPAAIGPLLVGNALALGLESFHVGIAIASLVCALLLQVAVNLANDYFDFKHGIDTEDRLGPVRVSQSGLIAPHKVRLAMIASLLAALAVGGILIWHGGLPIALLAAASILAALGYSGGPYPLASHGLGEVAALVFFGWVAVVGSYFLQAGHTSLDAWLLGTAIGALNAAIMLVNNTRDMVTDERAGKRTLAVRLGEAQAKVLYQALLYLPFGIIIGGFLMGLLPGWPVFLAGLSLIIARRLAREFAELSGAALNPLLGRTARLTLIFSLLFCAGLLIVLAKG